MLTDDQSNPARWPTGNIMRAHMRQLVGDAQPGDSLVFHFSGELGTSRTVIHPFPVTSPSQYIEQQLDREDVRYFCSLAVSGAQWI